MRRGSCDSPFKVPKVLYLGWVAILLAGFLLSSDMVAFGGHDEVSEGPPMAISDSEDAEIGTGKAKDPLEGAPDDSDVKGTLKESPVLEDDPISAKRSDADSEEESDETEEPDTDGEDLGNPASETVYDPQPATKEEVQDAIDAYNAAYVSAMENGGFPAALEIPKPHWEFEVAAESMPSGYDCQLVDGDESFGAIYYTFFPLPIALSSTWDGSIATSIGHGSGTEQDPYQIWSAQELAFMAQQVNAANASYIRAHYVLMDDIDLNGLEWTCIGNPTGILIRPANTAFRGVFDGSGKTISGLSINKTLAHLQGLFGYVWDASIKDLTLEGSIKASSVMGLLVGASNGNLLIENCTVRGTVDGGHTTGGLIGEVNTGYGSTSLNPISGTIIIRSCWADVTVTSSAYSVGGLVGEVLKNNYSRQSSVLLVDCHAFGNVKGSGHSVGGLAGSMEIYPSTSAEGCSLVVGGCSARGDVAGGHYYNGGLIGYLHNGIEVKNSWATGDVSSTSYSTGGLIGYAYGHSIASASRDPRITVVNCYASGNVTASSYVGGLIGFADNLNVSNSYAIGNVNGTSGISTSLGGFVGRIYSSTNIGIEYRNCYATGTVMLLNTTSGGFFGSYGSHYGTNIAFISCYYDKTTTRQALAAGTASNSIPSASSITAYTTRQMIDLGRWDYSMAMKNNLRGAALGIGSDEEPWYIDDGVTYPYLYYQYDGRSKDEQNYHLGDLSYTTDNGVSYAGFTQERTDFIMGAQTVSARFKATSQGAAQMYFPYVAGHYLFAFYGAAGKGGTIDVPASAYQFIGGNPYSLGSVSQSGIVAFTNTPYGEKWSDRPAWVEGDEATYTMRGDIVTYWVETSNPSSIHRWEEVVIVDELAYGLTLVAGSVKITEQSNDAQGMVISSKTTVLTTVPDDRGAYYACAEDGATGRWTLVVHLPNHEPADGQTGTWYSLLTEYRVFVGKDAVSLFPLNDWVGENGDAIRNVGTASGILRNTFDESIESPYKICFDDGNTDPVYDSYTVIYHGNGGTLHDGSRETYEEQYLLDAPYTVLPNDFDTDGDGLADDRFTRFGCTWQTWYSIDPGTSGHSELTVGSIHSIEYTLGLDGRYSFSNVDIYAGWEEWMGSITIEKFGHSPDVPLADAAFSLEKLDDQGQVDPGFATRHLATGLDGALVFTDLPPGTYRVVETMAPQGLSQLIQPFEATIPYSVELPPTSAPEPGYSDQMTDPVTGYITYFYYDLTYQVSNQTAPDMPPTGFEYMPDRLQAGLLFFAAILGAVFCRSRRLSNRKECAVPTERRPHKERRGPIG